MDRATREDELSLCGLPVEAYQSKFEWLQFLEHGYIQSNRLHISQWWSTNLLSAEQAKRLLDFICREYADQYPGFVQDLQRVIKTSQSTPAESEEWG